MVKPDGNTAWVQDQSKVRGGALKVNSQCLPYPKTAEERTVLAIRQSLGCVRDQVCPIIGSAKPAWKRREKAFMWETLQDAPMTEAGSNYMVSKEKMLSLL